MWSQNSAHELDQLETQDCDPRSGKDSSESNFEQKNRV